MRSLRLAISFVLLGSALAIAAPPESLPRLQAGSTDGAPTPASYGVVRDVRAPAHLQPQFMVPPAPPEECCGNEDAGIASRKLGRAIPRGQYDYGRFHVVIGQDGKARAFPRLCQNVDTSRRKAPPPASVDWSAKAASVIARMYLNDRYGCCVPASRYHQLGIMSAADGGPALEADDAEVYSAYQSACGRGDNGCDMSAVNVYQQKVGLKVKGVLHKSDGSVRVDNTNADLVKAAIAVFGGANVGMKLPNDWYASKDGADWGPTNSKIVGGHEVQAFGYDAQGVWISTWGGKRRILWSAFNSTRWIDELYVTLSPDWYGSDKLAPNGIDAATLAADLALVSGGKIPPLPDPAPPTPPTPPTPPAPPQPPVPPAPGVNFTGSLVYQNGVLVQVVPGGAVEPSLVDHLKGIDPAIIADVVKLISDLRGKKGFAVLMADVMKILADLAALKDEGKIGCAEADAFAIAA